MILIGTEALFICAVSLFVLITGYYGCTTQRREPTKAIGLMLQSIIFCGAVYLISWVVHKIYHFCADPALKLLKKLLDRWTLDFSVFCNNK